MEYLTGIVLYLAVVGLAVVVGLDRESGFYPTLLIVIASYYVLFAVMGDSRRRLLIEISLASGFLDPKGLLLVRFLERASDAMNKAIFHAVFLCIASLTIAAPPATAQHQAGTGISSKLRTHVEQDVLRKLKPYFPKAKTKLDENGTLIILTCAQNLGPVMLRKIQPEIESQFYSAGLLAEIGLALTRTKRVGVGFEREILIFNLNDHHDAWIDGAQISGYIGAYPAICN